MKTEIHTEKEVIEKSFFFRIDKRITVYLVCVLIASFFWLLNAMEKQYTTSVNVPITFTGFPAGKIVMNELPSSLNISVNGRGVDLLPVFFTYKNNTINIDFSQIKFNKNQGELYRIPTSELIEQLRKKISQSVKINSISPDTVLLLLNEKHSKLVRVKPKYSIQFKEQFNISDTLLVNPPVVRIYGPLSELEKINTVYTDSFYLEYPETSQNINVYLQMPEKHIEYEKNEIEVTIPIEKLTEKKIIIPVKAISLPDTLEIKTFPENVEVVILVPLSKYDIINESQFRAFVDYAEVTKNNNNRLTVFIDKKPESTIVNFIKPEKVEFIVRKK